MAHEVFFLLLFFLMGQISSETHFFLFFFFFWCRFAAARASHVCPEGSVWRPVLVAAGPFTCHPLGSLCRAHVAQAPVGKSRHWLGDCQQLARLRRLGTLLGLATWKKSGDVCFPADVQDYRTTERACPRDGIHCHQKGLEKSSLADKRTRDQPARKPRGEYG